MTLLPRRPLPEEHNSPTAWHAAAAWPTLCTRVRGLYRAAPRDAHARTHGPTGLGPGGSPPRVGAVHRAALEGLARSARRLGPARHTTPVSTVWATWAEAGARWPAWVARVRP